MDKQQLVKKIETSEYLLPKEIIPEIQIEELAEKLVEIFNDEKTKIETEKRFQRNYFELVNYVLIFNLNAPKSKRKDLFEASFLNTLLSIPEAA